MTATHERKSTAAAERTRRTRKTARMAGAAVMPYDLNDTAWTEAMRRANEVFGRAFAGVEVDSFVSSLRR